MQRGAVICKRGCLSNTWFKQLLLNSSRIECVIAFEVPLLGLLTSSLNFVEGGVSNYSLSVSLRGLGVFTFREPTFPLMVGIVARLPTSGGNWCDFSNFSRWFAFDGNWREAFESRLQKRRGEGLRTRNCNLFADAFEILSAELIKMPIFAPSQAARLSVRVIL